ncbi:MAG: aminotransferase class I/II-fold pyridoxal phosphate-dependent enzyme, partial [Clostridia bacterium]|nr:aminotransferase class I/II-fold pyridoxal phosphate-dependent enzyme [Clostridia bacterium]
SPDREPAPHIVNALADAVYDGTKYGYALSEGMPAFKKAVTDWYYQRFHVSLDPEKEVLSLMGSQDGLSHIFLAFLNPGDIALIPDPGYPVYSAGALIAGGEIFYMPLLKENRFLPDFEAIPQEVAQKAKIMILNYPSNPVTAVADLDFFSRAVSFAKKHDIIICHDVAYSELSFDGYNPPSFLETPGAKEVAVEFHSLSKSYNMAGCRIAFLTGNSKVIDALRRLKSNIDYGIFQPVQIAGIAALTGSQENVRENALTYQKRRDVLLDKLAQGGWKIEKPKATMFIWAPLPKNYQDSKVFTIELLEKTGVVVTPGIAFGRLGEGYVRIALVCEEERLLEAANRILSAGICR